DVSSEALRRMKERKQADRVREELQQAAAASGEQARRAAEQVAREVAGKVPAEDRVVLESYLAQIPEAVRQSMRRVGDPSGRPVPADFALTTAADLMRVIPAWVSPFRSGVAVPGAPDWQLARGPGRGG